MKKSNKILKWLGGIIVLLIIIAIIGKKAGWFGKANEIKVSTAIVELKTVIETVSANGKIQPETEVKISSDVSGEIRELYVKEGDSVSKGQLLARIDPELYASALDRSSASLSNAKASAASSKARLLQAEARFIEIEKQYNRTKKMAEQKLVSDAEIENITNQVNSLTATRVNLYNTLAKNYHNEVRLEQSVSKSMEQQTKTLKILERELNKSKSNLAKLKDEKYNQLKMIEINTYFGKQYENHVQLIKIIIVVGVCMLATLLLNYVEALKPASQPLFNLVTIVGGFFIVRKLVDLYLRKNDNYDEYEWPVAPTTDHDLTTANAESTSFIDVSGVNILPPGMCFGTSCCSLGTTWVDGSGCVIDPNYLSSMK